MSHEVELAGCAPEPLMSYLKALGVFRLVAEQADPDATACWRADRFVLRSKFDEDGLVEFFLHEYKPTPILAPWNAGSGFYKKWNPGFPSREEEKAAGGFAEAWDPVTGGFKSRDVVQALNAIERSSHPNLAPYRDAILRVKRLLQAFAEPIDIKAELAKIKQQAVQQGWTKKQTTDAVKEFLANGWLLEIEGRQFRIATEKDRLLGLLRGYVLDDSAMKWLDTALVLVTGRKKNRLEAPLLGSGGNIGNSDFSGRFMQLLAEVLPFEEGAANPGGSKQLLQAAIHGGSIRGLREYAVDQFNPGTAGGANQDQGFEASPRLNAWDYILMLEGSLLMAGTASRRLDACGVNPAFPFCVDSASVGFTSPGEDDARGEIWLPLWERPCGLAELTMLLSEGRANLRSRPARDSVEFARAVAALGVDRGIQQFVRIQFQKRFGDNYLANVLGRFHVRHQRHVHLIDEVEAWFDRYRYACSGGKPKTPPRFMTTLRGIESSIFDYCRYGRVPDMQSILIALGEAERELALTIGCVKPDKNCDPVSQLSPQWLTATHDGSREYEVALALAGIYDREGKLPPIRANVEPVQLKESRWSWSKEVGPQVVWKTASLTGNMIAVLERRILDGLRNGCETLPLDFKRSAPLEAVTLFLAGELDDERIERLFRSLLLVDHRAPLPAGLPRPHWLDAPPLPRQYALLKLLFLPAPLAFDIEPETQRPRWRLARKDERGLLIRPEPRVLPLLRADRVGEACRIAYERLRACGLNPLPSPMGGRPARVNEWAETSPIVDAHRLAAALLLPLSSESVNRILQVVTRTIEEPEEIELLQPESEGV